jgi:hypothetical protein
MQAAVIRRDLRKYKSGIAPSCTKAGEVSFMVMAMYCHYGQRLQQLIVFPSTNRYLDSDYTLHGRSGPYLHTPRIRSNLQDSDAR